MISYGDMTFCTGTCDYIDCFRNTHNIPKDDKGMYDTKDLPIAFADFRSDCPNYIKPMDYGVNNE